MLISYLHSKSLIWIQASSSPLMVPCRFFFISLSVTFFLPLCCHVQWVLWASWSLVLWTLYLIGWLSWFHLVLFLGFCSVLSLGHISLSPQFDRLPVFVSVCYVELLWLPVLVMWPIVEKTPGNCVGWSLRYLLGWGNTLHCLVVLCGVRLNMGQCCCLDSWGLSGTGPISSHFTHFLVRLAPFQLLTWWWISEWVGLCMF